MSENDPALIQEDRRIHTISFNKIITAVAVWALVALQGIFVYLYLDVRKENDKVRIELSTKTSQTDAAVAAKIIVVEARLQTLDDKKTDMILFNQAMASINTNFISLGTKMDVITNLHIKPGR